jgi:NO-binding membrane sensor protein with MHYT domain
MNKRASQRAYLSEWFLELSVLLTVFPGLDLALEDRFDPAVLGVSAVIAVLSFLVGLALAKESA